MQANVRLRHNDTVLSLYFSVKETRGLKSFKPRIKALELDAGVRGREAPVGGLMSVAAVLPCGDLPAQGLRVGDARSRHWGQNAQFDLRHVEPTAMLGRVMDSKRSASRRASAGGKAS